jgi:iron complex outermembrane recepter protein
MREPGPYHVRRAIRWLLPLVILGCHVVSAAAQSVVGTVRDESGGALTGVGIRAQADTGGPEVAVSSGANGQYRLVLPSPGRYVVTFDLPGFVKHHVRNLDVAETDVSLDVMLRVTSFAEQIRVASDLNETHTTGSRLGLTRHELPASIDIVTQEVIQARGADTASTALRYVTGVTSSLRPGASAVFSSRGFVENSLGLLFNGVRVQSSTVTMRNYDAFNFERVEVLRGPASVLYGEGLAAGAINFVRREPMPGRHHVDALVETGDAGRFRFGAAAAGSAGARSGYTVSFARNRFETHVEDNVHAYNHLTGAFRTTMGRLSLSAEGDFLNNSVDDPYWGTPLVNGQIDETLYGRNYNRSPNNRYDDAVGWGRLTAAGALRPRLVYNGQLYMYRADRDWRNSYGFEFLPETGRVQRRAVENLAYDHRLWGTRHDLTADFTIANRSARFVAGVDAALTDFSSPRSYGPRVTVDLLAPESLPFVAPPRADDRRADITQKAAYGEFRVAVAPPLTVLLGGRASRIENDIARPASGVAFTQSFTPVDGSVGVVLMPRNGVSIYGQYATGSEPVDGLVILGLESRDFELARSRMWEGGIKVSAAGGRLDMTAAAYWIAKANLTTTDPNDSTRTIQIGEQSSRGFELAALLRSSDRWLIETNVAAFDARYDLFFEGATSRAGNLPPNVPELVFNLGTTFKPVARVEAGVWLTRVGRRAADTTNLVYAPAYTLVDPFVRVTFGRAADLTVRVKNASDERYVEWATRAFGVTNVYFGEPRRLVMSLRVRL